MIKLPDLFRRDIELDEKSIYPVIHWDIKELLGSDYDVVLSTHPLSIENSFGLLKLRPVIDSIGNIQESIDLHNKKFTTRKIKKI